MAKKSKTQKAKASANRQAKKEAAKRAEVMPEVEEESKGFFATRKAEREERKEEKAKAEERERKALARKHIREDPRRFGFISDIRSEMRRVTWPTKKDVLQWTGVVVSALIFFGLFCVVLDDGVVTPLLYAISSLGA